MPHCRSRPPLPSVSGQNRCLNRSKTRAALLAHDCLLLQSAGSALPKAAGIAHREDCFQQTVLEQSATQAGVLLPRPRDQLLDFEGLAGFTHFLDWACGLASRSERIAERSDSSSLQLTEPGSGCADLIVTPSRWTAWRGRLPALLDAVDAGFAAAEQNGLAPVGLVSASFALNH